jgi:hypothetical protein
MPDSAELKVPCPPTLTPPQGHPVPEHVQHLLLYNLLNPIIIKCLKVAVPTNLPPSLIQNSALLPFFKYFFITHDSPPL